MSDGQGGTSARHDNIGRGILFALIAVVVFGIQDAVAKTLVQSYSPFHITMMRFWAFAAFSLFLVARQGPLREALKTRHPWLQIGRGLLLVLDIWCFAIAVKTVPLAELQAISLVYPLMITLLAIPLLGEKVGVFRFAAVIAGFLGAMVIVRPGGLPLDWGVGFAVLSSAAYALYACMTRIVSRHDSTATSMVYVGLIGLVLSTAVGIGTWTPMDLNGVLLAFKIGGTGKLAKLPPVEPRPFVTSEERFTPAQLAEGEAQYFALCTICHNGPVNPDLLRSPMAANAEAWRSIVMDGALADNGMISFEPWLSAEQSEAIRGYILTEAARRKVAED